MLSLSFPLLIVSLSLLLSPTRIYGDFRSETILEAEPIYPTFDVSTDYDSIFRPERQENSNDSVTGCNYVTTLELTDFGTITSPNYPRNYPSRQSCSWILKSPPGTKIEATFFDLYTQPWLFSYFDYIMVSRNGLFTDSERYFGDLNAKTPMTISSESNRFGIEFRSSNYFNFRGFKLQYLVRPDTTGELSYEEPIYLDGICGQSLLLNTNETFAKSEAEGFTPRSSVSTTEETTTMSFAEAEEDESSTEYPSSRTKTNSKYLFLSTTDLDERVFGGIPTKPFAYPWMAALLVDGRSFCGGSLIDDRHVLTAAHCTDKAKRISVLLGSHNLKASKSIEPSRLVINVTRSAVFQHPDYNRRTITHDISIIRLPEPVTFTKEIQPVCLPNKYFLAEAFEQVPVRVSGWGKTRDNGGSISPQLQHVGVTVMSNAECKKAFRGIVTGNLLCVETKQRQSPCKGDSGGPLMVIQKGPLGEFFMQLGIVSFGSRSCEHGQPVGFTRITAFLDFISQVTGRNA